MDGPLPGARSNKHERAQSGVASLMWIPTFAFAVWAMMSRRASWIFACGRSLKNKFAHFVLPKVV